MDGFPIRLDQPVSFDMPIPPSCDCIIIGGGIIGVMTALELARAGQSVVLLEKGRVAGEQSSRNWGWIRAQGRDPDELPILLEAQRMWPELAKSVDTDIGLRTCGVAYLADSENDMVSFRTWLASVADFGLSSRLLSASQTSELIPSARGWRGAMWTPTDMRAEPWVTVPALARLAVKEGVTLVENCAVRSLEMQAGRVVGVSCEKGRIAASSVVLAGGAWSSRFLQQHGVDIPQLSVRATVCATKPLPVTFDGAAVDSKLAFRLRSDGGYTLAPAGFHELFIGPDSFRHFRKYLPQLRQSPFGTRYLLNPPKDYPDAWRWSGDQDTGAQSVFEAQRILNPSPNMAKVAELQARFLETFPQLGQVKIAAMWAGMIDVMPDTVPIIDEVPDLPGLVLATGFSGHGFGIGPGAGRVVSRIVQGIETGFDLKRFRFDRFADGSPIILGPSL
jgi:glycine/D-amino acid oxidase-like deaminating enzyme